MKINLTCKLFFIMDNDDKLMILERELTFANCKW